MSPILQAILALLEEALTNPVVKAWILAQLATIVANPATPYWEKFIAQLVINELGGNPPAKA